MDLDFNTLKEFLDEKAGQYNTPDFIELDPIQIPHMFTDKEDIEISGFLAAIISWGNRKSIINSARRMIALMGNSPYEFIMNHSEGDLDKLDGFVHRTFNSIDLKVFIKALRYLYTEKGGLEVVFKENQQPDSLQPAIHHFKQEFFSIAHPSRTRKHLPDPFEGSAGKKINMYLRWMIRKDNCGVDFGIWESISPSILSCPLDVHTGNISRKLGLLSRTQNDAKAVNELDSALRKLDPKDPVKYDFALFGLGAYEKYKAF